MNVGANLLELLDFEVGGQHYGLPSSDIKEILPAVTLVPLPKAPAIVEGIVNVRGTAVPVLDIRARFGLAQFTVQPCRSARDCKP